MRRTFYVSVVLASVAGALFLLSCGSGTNTTMMNATTVNVSISDPATCGAPSGQFSHVFVTITDVMIHQSASAGPNDPGWMDLTPNLKSAPVQTDLLGLATNQCFLAMLGSTGIQRGTFQQIRVILADNASTVAGNKCGSTVNCVMLTSDANNTPHPLLLSSEAQTGIKIPSGQIAGGQFTVAAGENKDLNIDFNACASIVSQGNGQFRLKPVLHAGEVSTTSASISGTVQDGATKQPIVGGNTVVALEQKDQNGVDRVIMETLAGANGDFVFCPVPAGMYDVVVTAINGAVTDYAATVITGVQPGNSLGNVPLTAAGSPAVIGGLITTSTGTAGTVADLSVSALQQITENGSNVMITTPLPLLPAATDTLTTAPGAGCPANTDCVNYSLSVPAANPSVGAFVTTGTQTPAPPAAGPVNYTVDANAFSAGAADCTPSNAQRSQTTASTPLTATAGSSVTAQTLPFTACQ
ncbi:MAG TPA: DUF4382 domain-containing protein [Candidatus Angelobacter sp.]